MPASNTYEPIASTVLTSAVSSVSFSSIPQTYTDLLFIVNSAGTQNNDPYLRLNSDSGTNYSYVTFTGNGTTPSHARGNDQTSVGLNYFGSDGTTLGINPRVIHMLNYSNTTTYKNILATGGHANFTDGLSYMFNTWRNTSAITQVVFYPNAGNYIAGSTFTLYGIKAA